MWLEPSMTLERRPKMPATPAPAATQAPVPTRNPEPPAPPTKPDPPPAPAAVDPAPAPAPAPVAPASPFADLTPEQKDRLLSVYAGTIRGYEERLTQLDSKIEGLGKKEPAAPDVAALNKGFFEKP